MAILDGGCGNIPPGNVNLGICVKGNVPNPIKADIHHLPLQTKSFSLVYSRFVLEHVNNPTKALREMLRVAKCKVFFVIPHRFFRQSLFRGHPKGHIHFF